MSNVNDDIVSIFKEIPWFENIGQNNPDKFFLPFKYEYASSKKEILNNKNRILWANAVTEAASEMSVFMDYEYQDLFNQQWNELGRDYGDIFDQYFKLKLLNLYNEIDILAEYPLFQNHDYDEESIVLCMMYFHWKEILPINYFFENIFLVFKNGLYPCGWCKNKYPDGNILLF